MKVVVLGAGVVGVSTAWWLREAGHEVVVIDRRPAAALETSHANAGHLSRARAAPWASPAMLRQLVHWTGRARAPLQIRVRPSVPQWLWCARFLLECRSARHAANLRAIRTLAQYSHEALLDLCRTLPLAFDHQADGILAFYRDARAWRAGRQRATRHPTPDPARRWVTAAEALAIEPALAAIEAELAGGDFAPHDESGDAHAFSEALAQQARQAGVVFHFNTEATRLVAVTHRVSVVELIGPRGDFRTAGADAFVVALGSQTPGLIRPLGLTCPVYPVKGYSATFPIVDARAAPTVALMDQDHRVAISRLGDRLRMAAVAQIGDNTRQLDTLRCNQLVAHARSLFPNALAFDNVQFWSGLRPATPSGVPLIGRTRLGNLYLNTGHGSLGWAMGPGSGRALADLVSGRIPAIDFPFLG